MNSFRLLCPLLVVFGSYSIARAQLHDQALAAAKQATTFLTDQVSTRGGYLWSYSADLKHREGEGVIDTETVWVQPPGTPAVGSAFVKLYQATGDSQFLQAALATADALRSGQMRSGGWQAHVEFDADRRKKWAYRIDATSRKSKDQSSLDDAKTQAALLFLVQLDAATNFSDDMVHEMTLYGLDGLLNRGQFSGGGFPQVWTDGRPEGTDTPRLSANYPDDWSRTYPGHQEYWYRYTLNDHLASDVMDVLLLADRVYRDSRYQNAALKLADSLVDAQMPNPQPAWAQQYNSQMQPIWARKFEPPAITSSESFSVIETLMKIYRHTGNRKYLAPIPKALDYLQQCELPDGRVARFYELKTNRPLYFTRDYQLTYDDSDMPTHYGFQLGSKVSQLRKKYDRLAAQSPADLSKSVADRSANPPSDAVVKQIVDGLDPRGAWLSDTPLRFNKLPGPSIQMSQTVENLTLLADYLAAEN
ncbi:pectate lyase [Stieleria sp. TO1_6]|uniref:pectate lyase n=1 Tax=Stieleria tagensis TaxID=2956795 RepID=UPI00209B8D1B|nr:pectate lyase [Stieleria tagensis]MCO8122802.1 pectate lyase [Stieleria tagensis]